MPWLGGWYVLNVVLADDVPEGYGRDQGEDVVHRVDVAVQVLEHVDRREGQQLSQMGEGVPWQQLSGFCENSPKYWFLSRIISMAQKMQPITWPYSRIMYTIFPTMDILYSQQFLRQMSNSISFRYTASYILMVIARPRKEVTYSLGSVKDRNTSSQMPRSISHRGLQRFLVTYGVQSESASRRVSRIAVQNQCGLATNYWNDTLRTTKKKMRLFTIKMRKHHKAWYKFQSRYLRYTNRIIIKIYNQPWGQQPGNYQDYAGIGIISQLMEGNNWKEQADRTEAELAKEIEASKAIELKVKEAIECIGNQHRYQIILTIYLILCFVLSTYLLIGTSYFFMNPEFKCNGQPLAEKEACKLPAEECVLENDYTITSYVGLYCERSAEREGIQAMLGIGACLGVLFINLVSDYWGRRFSFLCSLLSGLLSVSLMIVGAYTGTVWIFFGSQILAAFCGNSIFTLVYVMSDRLMSKKYSNYCILITNGFFALSQASLALFTGLMAWQQLSIGFMLIPSIFLIIASRFLIIQDPAFLFTKARFEECKLSLKTIAVFNRSEDKLDECYGKLDGLIKSHIKIDSAAKQTGLGQKLKYLHLLLKREVLMPIVMIGVFNLGGNINYYAFNYAISGIGYSYSVQIVLFGLVEFIGVFPMMFLGNKTPRKAGLMALIAMQIAFSLLFIMNMSKMTETVLVVLVRFMLTNQYMLYIYLVVETFPQHIQATSFGIVEFIGQMGKLIAPYTINLSTALTISPILLTGIVSVIFQIFTLLPLRETLASSRQQQSPPEDARQSLLQADGESASGLQFE